MVLGMMILCMGFAHDFGHNGFLPMVSYRSDQGNYGYVLIQGSWIGVYGCFDMYIYIYIYIYIYVL